MHEPLTLAIIALTVLVSWHGFRDPWFVRRFVFEPQAILRDKQGWRLFTCGFLHADWFHLIFNMYSFYSFGRTLEWIYGPLPLLVVYLASVVGGSLLSLFLHRHHVYQAYGASGGVCGIIFASIFLTGSGVRLLMLPFSMPGWLYAILFLLGSFYATKQARDNVGHDAHLGGAIIGLLVATAMYPEVVGRQPWLLAAVLGLSLTLLVLLVKNPFFLPFTSFIRTTTQPSAPRSPAPAPGEEAERINVVLEKVARSGLGSLTRAEHAILLAASRKSRPRGE